MVGGLIAAVCVVAAAVIGVSVHMSGKSKSATLYGCKKHMYLYLEIRTFITYFYFSDNKDTNESSGESSLQKQGFLLL